MKIEDIWFGAQFRFAAATVADHPDVDLPLLAKAIGVEEYVIDRWLSVASESPMREAADLVDAPPFELRRRQLQGGLDDGIKMRDMKSPMRKHWRRLGLRYLRRLVGGGSLVQSSFLASIWRISIEEVDQAVHHCTLPSIEFNGRRWLPVALANHKSLRDAVDHSASLQSPSDLETLAQSLQEVDLPVFFASPAESEERSDSSFGGGSKK